MIFMILFIKYPSSTVIIVNVFHKHSSLIISEKHKDLGKIAGEGKGKKKFQFPFRNLEFRSSEHYSSSEKIFVQKIFVSKIFVLKNLDKCYMAQSHQDS